MSLSVKAVSAVTDGEYVAGFVSEEGGRGRLFSKKASGDGAHNLPKASGAPVAVTAPEPEYVVDETDGNSLVGPYYLNLTYDPASPDAGSNGRFLVTDGTQVIIASTATG